VAGSGFSRSFFAPSSGQTAVNVATSPQSTGAWVAPTSVAAVSFLTSLDANASVEAPSFNNYRVRYWDQSQLAEVFNTSLPISSATAQPTLKTLTRFGAPVAASSAYISWTNGTQLSVACSAAPFAIPPTWRISNSTLGGTLSSAMSGSTFVVVGEFGGDVIALSTPLTGCAANPVLSKVGTLPGAKEPAVTIDSTGHVWVVAISTSTGGLMVSRF
jgi:hypothetical protein